MHTNNNRFFPAGLLGFLLWLMSFSPLAFTACDNPQSELAVDISLSSDFRGIAEAIRSGSLSLAEALSQVETAVTSGFADHAAAQQLLQQAVFFMSGTADEKLAAIEAAVGSQTIGLETKLGLIEAAVANGFVDAAEQRALMGTALSAMAGTVGEKLAAVEAVVNGQTASLSSKLGLIEKVVKEGLADEKVGLDLLQKAIQALTGTAEEKLAAMDTSMMNQATSLAAKLDLIEAAVKSELADNKAALALLQQAVGHLTGTLDEKLAAIDSVVQDQQLDLDTKLELIEAAVTNGFADYVAAQELLLQVIQKLEGTAEAKMATIEAAVRSQTSLLSSKLALIGTAVNEGFAEDSLQQGLIRTALDALNGTAEENLGAINAVMGLQTTGLATKLETIQLTLADSLATAREALGLILTAVQSLQKSLDGTDPNVRAVADNVLSRLRSLDATLEDQLVETLSRLTDAVKAQNQKDYSAILTALTQAVEELEPEAPVLVLSSSCIEGDKIWIMSRGYIDFPYSVMSEGNYQIEITCPRDSGFTYSLYPDKTNPSKGKIRLTAGNIVNGEMTVQFTVTDGHRSSTQTFYYKELVLEMTSEEQRWVGYEGDTEELLYRTNVSCQVAIPDSIKPWVKIVSSGDKGDDQYIKIEVAPNYGHGQYREGQVSITELLTHNAHTLSFYIKQPGTSIIRFRDPNLEAMLVANEKVNINRDTCITWAEVKEVRSLEDMFGEHLKTGADYTSFNEFENFTGITDIPAGSFHNWKNLNSIYLPSEIKTIGGGFGDIDGPFTECPKLDTLRGKYCVDEKALVYNGQLLKVVESLTRFTIPDNVSAIGSKAFYQSKIKDITFPSSVKTIRDHAFEYSDIESVTFAMSGADPGTATAYVDSLAENAFVHCFKLKEFNGPTKTGTNALRVTPDKLGMCFDTTMCAFAMGTNQTTFTISENMGIKKLADGLFDAQNGKEKGAVQLREVILPATLTHIGHQVFQSQANLSSGEVLKLYFKGENPPVVEGDAFNNINKKAITLYYPAVLNSDNTVNTAATNERKSQFRTAMKKDEDFFNFEYYSPSVSNISFADSKLKAALIAKGVDTDQDGEISLDEAAAVTSLDSLFGPGLYNGQLDGHKCAYTSFDEFQYFTGIDTIPAGSFHNWVNLTSITLPSSITTIEGGHDGLDGPFAECPKLEVIKGPFTVNDQMLVYNKQLLKVAETATSVTIPAGVEIIDTKAFYKSNIKSITIPSSVKKIRDHAFEYSQVETVAFAMTGTNPQTATAYVDSLAETSFVHCFKLKTFKGPENGTSTVRVTRDRLGLCRDTTLYAFAMGSGLVDYAIPESAGVKKLAAYVFSAQPSTSSVNPDPSAVQWLKIGLPSTLTHIGDHAFSCQKATPKMEVFFKGENPPKADAGAFDNTLIKRVMVPPVKNGDQVDIEATTARGHQFENAMGGDNYFSPSYYPVWPFAEGIPMVAKIAAKQGYVCESNSGSSIPGQWSAFGQDTVAVLYTVEGENKRAHARVAAVDANGAATISFVVDYKTMNVTSNTTCQLVYPPRAVNDANTGPKDYNDMSGSQTGDKSKYLDVHIGSGSFNTAGAPFLTINTPLHPIYSIVIINLASGKETELSIKDANKNPVVTINGSIGGLPDGRETYYFSMPASNTNSMYHISGSKGQCSISVPTSSSYTQATPAGYVFPYTVTLQQQ
jgi:hypothetical protein